ncbi:nickel-type superoxide dismutase maturation protease [Kitasatospora sp. NA04385]|uniref:nickel-type superoxide dismutase maturation protease n=1 Tax=Kitasatospora sp. NA04385 TaxID=2742135 RepID=UPI0015906546|nr:nickel-type superoxide dismutase maturation protease [Kitasatospora sp. NA04385]QKW21508.1 nickel-type superoxide dismutase maturation protease [Kitasatospora sp. NA04385]
MRYGTPFGVADIAGPSMRRLLSDGDRVLVRYGARLRPGAIALFRHPLRQDLLVVKRAAERRPGGWWMLSDNPLVRTDSREYGAVPDELVLGRVLLRLSPRPAWLAPGRRVERALRGRAPRFAERLGVSVPFDGEL